MEPTDLLLGKMLGELYRMQRKLGMPCGASDTHVFGLLNGFEDSIESELEAIGQVPKHHVRQVVGVLDEIWSDPARRQEFTGFYDIEDRLEDEGVDRAQAIKILMYLKSRGQFDELIQAMDSSGSPTECRGLNLGEFDR